jgi:hypothetical protein
MIPVLKKQWVQQNHKEKLETLSHNTYGRNFLFFLFFFSFLLYSTLGLSLSLSQTLHLSHSRCALEKGKGRGDERRKKREMKKKTRKMRAMKGGGESERTSGLAPHFFISYLLYQDQEE